MSGGVISTTTFVAIEFFAFFGGVMWFAWRQGKIMERSIAEDRRAERERVEQREPTD